MVSSNKKNGGTVTRTFRFRKQIADRLAMEAMTRRINGEEPTSQQAIVEDAICMWLNTLGCTEADLKNKKSPRAAA